jgi:hypothetical protein
LMDVMHWILPIVCQGPFSQYRSVVVDSLSYYHRASEVERFLYKQSFTVNPTGAALGNTATGKNQVGWLVVAVVAPAEFGFILFQEYLNKKTKQAKRRDPTRAEQVGAETALLQDDCEIEERLRPIFAHLIDPSEGVMRPPEADEVIDIAKRRHWPDLSAPVDKTKGEDAKRQKPLYGMDANLDIVKKVIQRIGRAKQFGLGETEEDADSGSDCDDDNDALE